MDDLISRQAAIDALIDLCRNYTPTHSTVHPHIDFIVEALEMLPSAQPEPLTDQEQRIFLAAMEREEMVCKEVDRKFVREPYENSLMRVCKEIRRKVKGALWT